MVGGGSVGSAGELALKPTLQLGSCFFNEAMPAAVTFVPLKCSFLRLLRAANKWKVLVGDARAGLEMQFRQFWQFRQDC